MLVLPVSMDYGLSDTLRGHPISRLPHEPVMILSAIIFRASLLLFLRRWPLFSVARFTSLVRNPVSIEERFNPGKREG